MTKKFAVLGSPISHSKSPQIHLAAYRFLGLDWEYHRIELEAGQLGRVTGKDYAGFSVTMPLKHDAFELATKRDELSQRTRVANTLLRLDSGEFACWNTDVKGLANALVSAVKNPARVCVLGAGATATSAVLAAELIGAKEVTVVARRIEQASTLAEKLVTPQLQIVPQTPKELQQASDFDLVISTLPAGLDPSALEQFLTPAVITAPLFDVAYKPWPSPLAERWIAAGSSVHSGIEMLLHQAILQIRVFHSGDIFKELPDEAALLAVMRAAS